MITCYCEKCQYEFDADDPEEPDEIIFCPKCHLNPAIILKETPARKILREQRLAKCRRKKIFFNALILLSAGLITVPMIRFWPAEITRTAVKLLIMWANATGALAGLWFRVNVQYHSPRTGYAAAIVTFLFCTLSVLFGDFSLQSFLYGLCGILPGMVAAYTIGTYEKDER